MMKDQFCTEKEIQDFWEREGIYRFENSRGDAVFSIDTPPPTVSGSLHVGHIFSYTQAEMIARFRRMQGYKVFYPFGFDDNGLPTERLVEREKGIRAKDLPRVAFAALCRETADQYEGQFQALWKSMGFSVDWSLQYETSSLPVQKISQQMFLELAEMGKAYAKESPVLWCTECGTSVAQAELDSKEIAGQFHYLTFACEGENLEVATTRPELLWGCVCLFVHPEDGRYAAYIGKKAKVPLYDYEIPIQADGQVSMEKGTGVVMCATFGDSTDVQWVRDHDLPCRSVIEADGRLGAAVPLVGGLRVGKARQEIVRLLAEGGFLLRPEPIVHAVAVHERCGTAVEIIPSRQWYIDILGGKERFLEAGNQIQWHPAQMKDRYEAWVQNLKWDWCISRQRFFGVPFPVWYCKACGKPVFAPKESLPVDPTKSPYAGECSCGCTEFEPETAVLDTWATSSLTPQINRLGGLDSQPMSMRTHAHEIIRTWTFYSIVRSLYHTGEIPWKELMINGYVLAKKGEKISKSKGNSGLSPEMLIETHSADALRYWAANARLGTDTFFDPAELALSRRFLTKLQNAVRFAAGHLKDFDPAKRPEILPVDAWIIERTKETTRRCTELLNQYEIGSARHEIDELFWKDFCDNYVEIAKERLYQPDLHGVSQRESGQFALYYALINILKLYSVYVPHCTEAIYQTYFRSIEGEKSIHLLLWEKPEAPEAALLEFGEALKALLSAMRREKTEQGLSLKAELEVLEVPDTPFFRKSEGDLKACSWAKKVCYK